MKSIFINCSPRKQMNTAQLLKEAQKGAEAAGAETEYIDIFDYTFTGCRSCLACKRTNGERNKCFWKDDLAPIIDKVLSYDGGEISYKVESYASLDTLPGGRKWQIFWF